MSPRSSDTLTHLIVDLVFFGAGTAVLVAWAGAPTWGWVAAGLISFQIWRAATWSRA